MSDLVPKKRGRPPILIADPSIKERILEYVSQGAYMQTAFRAAGISDENYFNWLEWADNGKPVFREFFAALKKAEAEAELTAMTKMKDDPKSFVGNATYLERRFRDRWGRSDRHQIQADVNIRVESVDYVKLAKEITPSKSK